MANLQAKVCAAVGALGALVGAFLGGVDGLATVLICAVALDYLSGVASAAREKKLSSEVGFWGLVKKMFIFLMVGFAHLLDTHVLGGTAALRSAVIFFYLANEGLSVVENFARLGVPFPDRLKAALKQLKDRDGKDGT